MAVPGYHQEKDRLINALICDLLQKYEDQNALSKHLLRSILSLIPSQAPCTIIRIKRFFSQNNKTGKPEKSIDFVHINAPNDAELLETWAHHIGNSDSVIETRLFKKFGCRQVGAVRLRELFNRSDLSNRAIFQGTVTEWLIRRANIVDLAFAWMQCAPDEIWIVDLRRSHLEPAFGDDELKLLKMFIERFYDFREIWFKNPNSSIINHLTLREQEAVTYFMRGLKDKEVAFQMKISKRTLDTHWQNIFNKLGVSDKISVLGILGIINQNLTLLNVCRSETTV